MLNIEDKIAELQRWFDAARFKGTRRLYSAREVIEQRGRIETDYPVARVAAEGFYHRLRELFAERRSITTFGPYSPGQAVAMKRQGIEGIYLGGWATSAKGSINEDPGPDLASYPLSQVPDEAAPIVRALLTADKNQFHTRARMSEEERRATREVDYRPFIVADADTGHGGDAHVRNLVRRFVEVGVPGYHIEDQKPGVKKCGHQGGKVLVSVGEQLKRLSAARFQLDIMGVPGIIVARTDAEAATLLDGHGDERDQPFILGVTNLAVPSFRAVFLAVLRQFHLAGVEELGGHQIFTMSDAEYAHADRWLAGHGLSAKISHAAKAQRKARPSVDATFDGVFGELVDAWQQDAGVKTYAEAVADGLSLHHSDGGPLAMTRDEWLSWANGVGWYEAKAKAEALHIDVAWDAEHAKTPDGYYQVRGGIPYAVAKSLACCPYADLIWMETKTADLRDAKVFADAIHAYYPDKMLAYNLSPSFNWDTTGMSDEQMRQFPEQLAELGYVFNFITYGGHQVDGLASEEFAASLRADGMLALARLQRQLRLLESPYRTPQTLVGGPRADAGLMSISGRTATTRAMGKGSTQHQHLKQTEVSPKVLEEWLELWCKHNGYPHKVAVSLKPHRPGSDVLELRLSGQAEDPLLNIVFAKLQDRRGRHILSVRDQNTFDEALRRRRLMTLAHLFLIHRYKVSSVHYLTPSADNERQTEKMLAHGLFSSVSSEVGEIIVADVEWPMVKALLAADHGALERLIAKH